MSSIISRKPIWGAANWALAAAVVTAPLQAQATTFHTDTVFSDPSTGPGPNSPIGGLVADAQGRLYGAAYFGGATGQGSIFRLTPGKLKSDPWTTEVLHSFTGVDGLHPGAGLYLDVSGSVYGTTSSGGPTFATGSLGHGVVFRLDNVAAWPITILHDFGDLPDAEKPNSTLALGKDGRLYGTSFEGGKANEGTVFAISTLGDSVSYEIIHAFAGTADGIYPSNPTIQSDGAIYGITSYGSFGQAVFRLAEKDNAWRVHLIYAPIDQLRSLLNGPNGVLYLCSIREITDGYAIQLSPPPAPGPWIENDLYAFGSNQQCTSLTIDPSGSFVGTSPSGGRKPNSGSLFSLRQSALGNGAYVKQTLYRFPDEFENPNSALLRLGGLYYGTAYNDSGGTVFDVRP